MSALRDLIHDLTPIHEAMARFEEGGKQCSRDIEQIYTALISADRVINELREEIEYNERERLPGEGPAIGRVAASRSDRRFYSRLDLVLALGGEPQDAASPDDRLGAAAAPMPDTIMASAFLIAVLQWAQRQRRGSKRMTIPSGVVDADELRQVVVALTCARGAH
jgi:hypothetical protein